MPGDVLGVLLVWAMAGNVDMAIVALGSTQCEPQHGGATFVIRAGIEPITSGAKGVPSRFTARIGDNVGDW